MPPLPRMGSAFPRAARALLGGTAAMGCVSLWLFASGCYLSHEVERSVPFDGGPSFDAPSFDGTVRFDAGVDAAPRCALEPVGDERVVAVEDDGNIYAPDLFWTGERLGVVMSDDNAGSGEHGVVVMSHLDPELREVTAPRWVGEESHGWGEAAWNGDGFGLCWSADPGGMSGTHFREMDGLDGGHGPRTRFGDGSEACHDLLFAHGVYAVSWRQVYRAGDETLVDTMVQTMNRDGTRIGEPMILGTTTYGGYSPSLVVTASGFMAAVARDDGIRVVRFDPDGRMESDGTIPMPGVSYASVAEKDEVLALAALAGTREQRTLTFYLVDADTLRVRTEREIIDGTPTASRPRVLSRPEGFVLVWGEGARPSYRAMLLSIDPEGVPLAPRRVLHEGFHSSYGGPSMLNALGDVYLALSHELPDAPRYSREYTHVQRWRCNDEAAADMCQPQDASYGPGDCAVPNARWRFDGEQCRPLLYCFCEGSDCESLYTSKAACESDRRECLGAECDPASQRERNATEVCAPNIVAAGTNATLSVQWESCDCFLTSVDFEQTGAFELTGHLRYCDGVGPICECRPDSPPRTRVAALPPLAPGEWTIRFADREPITITSQFGDFESSVLCR